MRCYFKQTVCWGILVWLQITGGEPRCNEPLYNEDPSITKDIFQPSHISRTISRSHAELIVNHNTLYHPITIDTITKKINK